MIDYRFAIVLIVLCIIVITVACVVVVGKKERPTPPKQIRLFTVHIGGKSVLVLAHDTDECFEVLRDADYSVQAIRNSHIVKSEPFNAEG